MFYDYYNLTLIANIKMSFLCLMNAYEYFMLSCGLAMFHPYHKLHWRTCIDGAPSIFACSNKEKVKECIRTKYL